MISYHLSRHIEAFLSSFSNENYVISRIEMLSDFFETMLPHFVDLTERHSDANQVTGRCRKFAEDIGNGVREIRKDTVSSMFFNELHVLSSHARQFESHLHWPMTRLVAMLEQLKDAYDVYVDGQSAHLAAELAIVANRTDATIVVARETLQAVATNLAVQTDEMGDDEEALTLYFSSHSDLVAFSRKTSALLDAYHSLCKLLQIDPEEYPLKIVKIETGSTYLFVCGALLVMKLMGTFISKAAGIAFRRFVQEGRIEAELEIRKVILDELDLVGALRTAGIDTEKVGAQLQDLTERHVSHLTDLLYGEASIEVNGVETSVGVAQQEQFVEQVKLLRIGHQSNAPGEASSETNHIGSEEPGSVDGRAMNQQGSGDGQDSTDQS